MKTNRIVWSLLLVFMNVGIAKADPVEEGKSIFLSRCAACHNVNKATTGPALAGVDQRRSIEWIISFVHSSQTMVKSGDSTAVAMFEKFNKVPMPDHPDLTADQIKQIVEYIKTEAKPVEETTAPFAKPTRLESAARPLTGKDWAIFAVFGVLSLGLILALLFAVKVNTMKRAMQERKVHEQRAAA